MSILQYLQEAINKQNFIIPTKISKNFKVIGGLDNYKNWKTKVLMANSAASGVELGDWESPRYIMISLDSNNIIPIAISDEHQTGYDLLYEYYYEKKLLKQEKYISINGDGITYMYGNDDDKNKIEAFKKWLSYGGENQPVRAGGASSYIGDMQDVIERNGDISIIKGRLYKPGQTIINTIEHISKEYSKFYDLDKKNKSPNDDEVEKLFNFTIDFLNQFNHFTSDYSGLVDRKIIDRFIQRLYDAQKDNNWDELAQVILGMNGLKNIIHMELRKKKSNANLEGVFGDTELALQQFNRLGEI
jgi:hypothetical protein